MRRVNPGTARRGEFLDSFPIGEKSRMEAFCRDTERAMRRHGITGREVVYTMIITRWGKRGATWQVFLLRK
jgi:hypothetical protein